MHTPARAEIVEFACWLASGPNGMRLTAENTVTGWAPVTDLAAHDVSFAVVPRRDVVVFDADTVDDVEVVERVAQLAVDCDVPFALCESSPGRRHLFLSARGVPGDVSALLRFVGRAAGVDVRGRGVRPPGTRHRSGVGRSTVIAGDLMELSTSANPDAVFSLCRELGVPLLPDRLARAVRRGHLAAGFESASEARMALAVRAVSRGIDAACVADMLDHPQCLIGVSWRERPQRWQQGELGRLFTKAASWVETVDPQARRAVIDSKVWSGRRAMSDRAVLEALCAAAGVARDVALPVAELAALAGVGYPTAGRAVERLHKAGLLLVVAEPTTMSATVWRPVPQLPASQAPVRWTPRLGVTVASDLGSDFVTGGKLSRAALLAWRQLDDETPASVAEMAAKLGVSTSAARARLCRLRDQGLAVRTNDGWVRVAVDVAEFAADRPVPAVRARRMARVLAHRDDRRRARRAVAAAGAR